MPDSGGDGKDCFLATGALPWGGKGAPKGGGDEPTRVDGVPAEELPSGKSSSVPELAGPGVGLRPSRKAFAMSAAFHFEYLIFSSD